MIYIEKLNKMNNNLYSKDKLNLKSIISYQSFLKLF